MTAIASPLLRIRDLSVTYRAGTKPVEVVRSVNLDVGAG